MALPLCMPSTSLTSTPRPKSVAWKALGRRRGRGDGPPSLRPRRRAAPLARHPHAPYHTIITSPAAQPLLEPGAGSLDIFVHCRHAWINLASAYWCPTPDRAMAPPRRASSGSPTRRRRRSRARRVSTASAPGGSTPPGTPLACGPRTMRGTGRVRGGRSGCAATQVVKGGVSGKSQCPAAAQRVAAAARLAAVARLAAAKRFAAAARLAAAAARLPHACATRAAIAGQAPWAGPRTSPRWWPSWQTPASQASLRARRSRWTAASASAWHTPSEGPAAGRRPGALLCNRPANEALACTSAIGQRSRSGLRLAGWAAGCWGVMACTLRRLLMRSRAAGHATEQLRPRRAAWPRPLRNVGGARPPRREPQQQ
jgi:hypothetical protein